MENTITQQINVVFFRDEGVWIAHGVNLDIAAHGRDVTEARRAFEWAVLAEVVANVERSRAPFAGIPEAPSDIKRLFEEADAQLQEHQLQLPPGVEMPPAFMLPRVVENGRMVTRLN